MIKNKINNDSRFNLNILLINLLTLDLTLKRWNAGIPVQLIDEVFDHGSEFFYGLKPQAPTLILLPVLYSLKNKSAYLEGTKVGSVKDLFVIEKPEEYLPGKGKFIFSDRYSVFDWGEMPDHILEKGRALCIMGAYFFEKLESLGVKTHYLGLVEDNKVKNLSELNKPSNEMMVKILRVKKPEVVGSSYDYTSFYEANKRNVVVPLEIIYRNYLPEGSSVFSRMKRGELKPEDLGLTELPPPGSKLDKPLLDVSTKFEATDRYINWEEAATIAALEEEEMEKINKTTLYVNNIINQAVANVGLVNEDGKVEYGFDENGNIILVDILGTPDECRFTYQGLNVSKEVTRNYYRRTSWFDEVEKAKKKDRLNWKESVKTPPPTLPPELVKLVSQMYQSCCNAVTGYKWFDVPQLNTILSQLQQYL